MNESVLIIDDHEADRVYTRIMLERSNRWGPVHLVASGEEALRMYEAGESTPDLILLDINMPRMNGFDFLDALERASERKGGSAPMVVVLSSSEIDDDVQRARSYPVVRGFELKPLSIDRANDLADELDQWKKSG